MAKLSEAQRRILEQSAVGDCVTAGMGSISFNRSGEPVAITDIGALISLGLLKTEDTSLAVVYRITEDGRAALAERKE